MPINAASPRRRAALVDEAGNRGRAGGRRHPVASGASGRAADPPIKRHKPGSARNSDLGKRWGMDGPPRGRDGDDRPTDGQYSPPPTPPRRTTTGGGEPSPPPGAPPADCAP